MNSRLNLLYTLLIVFVFVLVGCSQKEKDNPSMLVEFTGLADSRSVEVINPSGEHDVFQFDSELLNDFNSLESGDKINVYYEEEEYVKYVDYFEVVED